MLQNIKKFIQKENIYRIVCIGDSLTSAEWVHPNWRDIVEYVLKQDITANFFKENDGWKVPSWNIRMINSGLDGATTANYVLLLEEYVYLYKPQLAIIMLGCNDALFLQPEATYDNLRSMIQDFKEANITVALANDPYITDEIYRNKYMPFHEKIQQLSGEADIFVDLWSETQQFPLKDMFTYISDGNDDVPMKPGDIDYLHPNPLGNAYIAKVFLKQIFGIDFDAEKYIQGVIEGVMFPNY
ncbi:hypothetical protein BH09PAT2_BH09PAT2_00610 [soil metagenome]